MELEEVFPIKVFPPFSHHIDRSPPISSMYSPDEVYKTTRSNYGANLKQQRKRKQSVVNPKTARDLSG